jgi:hypothetical protein
MRIVEHQRAHSRHIAPMLALLACVLAAPVASARALTPGGGLILRASYVRRAGMERRPRGALGDRERWRAGGPAWLQQAYDLTYLSQPGGVGDTVAVVDAYHDPTAEADLAQYRAN